MPHPVDSTPLHPQEYPDVFVGIDFNPEPASHEVPAGPQDVLNSVIQDLWIRCLAALCSVMSK